MKNKILNILNGASFEELYDMYVYLYGDCSINLTKEDIINHIYSYLRTYTKNHKLNTNFIIMYYNLISYIEFLEKKGGKVWRQYLASHLIT